MNSIRRLFHSEAKGLPRDSMETASTVNKLPKSKKLLPPSDHWTFKQLFSVFFMNGLGAFVISGGINFAVAYGLYAHVDVVKSPIRLWRLPNTLSGDAAITVFIQTVVTWMITLVLANADIRNGMVQPIGFVPEPRHKLLRWYLFLDAEQPTKRRNARQWVVFVFTQIARALLYAVPMFFLVWPAAVGILTSSTLGSHRGNDYYYSRRWTPQVFKLLYGGILGLLQTPPMYLFWLLTVGWREQRLTRTLPMSIHDSQNVGNMASTAPVIGSSELRQASEGVQRVPGESLAPPLPHEGL